ncbi:MAG: hypothetical protein H0W42_04025 [Gemmatimonadaceae bacterium]|nr:hypothetical protein [Gemmatimonadaceae bacterium]
MHASILTVALLLGTAAPLLSQTFDQCRHEAQRTANVDAAGARQLMVKAGAGSLKIEGKAGLDRVVIRGRACASSAQMLEDIELRAERRGSEIVVESMQREQGWVFNDNDYARLDLVIEVPMRIAAEIADGSGSVELMNLGAVDLTDGSGEIIGHDLHGDVNIRDGSGSITLTDLGGALKIHDGSGSIEVRGVAGRIDITDGSGAVNVRGARNSVRISDGSGSIGVTDVAGDLTIDRDGSGEVEYANVRGRVEIPRRRGRRTEAL